MACERLVKMAVRFFTRVGLTRLGSVTAAVPGLGENGSTWKEAKGGFSASSRYNRLHWLTTIMRSFNERCLASSETEGPLW